MRSATSTAGEYPGYHLRALREQGVELDITDEDREILRLHCRLRVIQLLREPVRDRRS